MHEHDLPSWDREHGFHRVSEPAAILRACARERVSATVQLAHSDCRGHFTRVLPDGIEIELEESLPADGPEIRGWCGFLFHHAGRACMVTGAVERSSSPRLLKMRRPFSMQIQRRSNPRVTIPREHGMAVRVGTGDVWWHPKPVDLSRTGIGLAFHESNAPDWPEGKIVSVDLVHRLDAVSVKALVVRREGCRYGLAFIPVSGARMFEVRVGLERILHDLDRGDVQILHVA